MSLVKKSDMEFFISWIGFKVSPLSFSVPSELTGDRKSKKNNVPKKHTTMRTVKTNVLVDSSKWFLSWSAKNTNVFPKNILKQKQKLQMNFKVFLIYTMWYISTSSVTMPKILQNF